MGRANLAVCAAIVGAAVLACAAAADDWTGYGDSPERTGAAEAVAARADRAFVLPVDGRVVGQVLSDDGTFFAATTAGEVVAFTAGGFVRWRDDFGQLASSCQQLDGYGIVGTGVIDPAGGTLYVADAFGRLHALDVATGAERAGWPLRVVADFRRELVWGALTLADGAVYVPTASYCDSTSLGGVYRVDLATQQVTSWTSVPAAEGGGGGVWGWGGTAYSPEDDALYAVTANAFAGGSNSGSGFTESAGYGEHLVKLAPDLGVEDSDHPDDLAVPGDLDFVGSPVVFDRAGCGELVVGADKDDVVYAWRAGAIGDGPVWELPLEPYDAADPMLSQLAWSPELASLYAVTGTQLERISVEASCAAHVDWSEPIGTHTENGSPTVAGDTVWFAANGTPKLLGYDARTGEQVFAAALGGTTVEAPTISDGRIVVGTMSGLVDAFSVGPAADPPAVVSATSWASSRLGWQSRSTGLYSTDDGGRSWRQVYAGPTLAALRISRREGLISVGDDPGACMCATRQLWTIDAGAHWHDTATLPEHFARGGGRIYFWTGGRLGVLATAPRTTSSSRLASATVANLTDGAIKAVDSIPGGIAALVTSRVHGQGWDTTPRVLLVHGTEVQTLALPTVRGRVLVQRLDADWPNLTVTATDFVANPARTTVWSSSDGGASWTAE